MKRVRLVNCAEALTASPMAESPSAFRISAGVSRTRGNGSAVGAAAPAGTDSAFIVLLWLLAAAAVLPGALDLPFLRGDVATASQLDSLVGRATATIMGLVAAFTVLTRIAGPSLSPVFGILAWFWGTLLLISASLGDDLVDLIRPFFLVVLAIALAVCRVELSELLWHARAILRLYLLLCLSSLLVAPDYAWYPSSGRQWLGLDQFAGIAPHPNALGPIAALALLLEVAPGGSRRLRWLFGAAALGILMMTQSRAGWAAGLVAVSIIVLIPAGRIGRHRAIVVFQGLLVAALAIALLVSDSGSQSITNGRLELWAEIIERAERSWLFGYGNAAFGATNRAANGFATWAGQAHNQILESLFTGGVFALVPLLFLAVTCTSRAFKAGPQRPITLAAWSVLFIDVWVESPLRPGFSAPVLMSILVLAILSSNTGSEKKAMATKTRNDRGKQTPAGRRVALRQ